jgi:Flp pilus assembly protein TadG
MSRISNRLLRDGRRVGQTSVEMAVAAIALLVILFAIIEMGLAIYRYNMVCSAAREAVRYAIVHPSDTTGIQQAAINSAPFLTASNITVTFPADPNVASRTDARVAISYPFSLGIPLLPLPSSVSNLTLSSTSQMMLAQ